MARLALAGLLAAFALLAVPATGAASTTYHGTFTTAQHYCGAAGYGPRYDVLGTWNLNVGTQDTQISFNYKNPDTGVHAVWSLLNDWITAGPYHFTKSLGGFYGFDVLFVPATGSFTYTIALPDCSYTGWDRLVATGVADRG